MTSLTFTLISDAVSGCKLPRSTPPRSLDHGRFQSLERCLGRGLYGDVWLYIDRLAAANGDAYDDPRVAIKETRLDIAREALATHDGRLDNPHRAHAVLQDIARHGGHPNILRAGRQFYHNGSWFLVTPLCTGGDLLSHLQRLPDGRMTERAALTCVAQITRGLHFLHQVVGVAHRDVSLENVLEHEGIYKIVDFGLAVSATSRCRGRVGKAYYMAPEVVASEEEIHPHPHRHCPDRVDEMVAENENASEDERDEREDANEAVDASRYYDPKAADVWSLGIVLFVLLTGSPLVPSASRREPSFRALEHFGVERVLEAWGLRDGLSAWTVELLVGMIQVDPLQRLTTAQVLGHPALTMLPPLQPVRVG